MKVLHFVDSFSPIGGGSQTAVLTWFRELATHPELQLEVISNTSKVDFPVPADHHIELPTVDLGLFFPQYTVSYKVPKDVEDRILRFAPDLIHLHEPQFLTQHFLDFAKFHKIPVIATYHTDFGWYVEHIAPPMSWMSQLLYKTQRSLFTQSTAMTAPTNYWRKRHADTYHKDVYTVPYPIENTFFNNVPKTYTTDEQQIKLITVSRLSIEKRIDILIKSMTHLDERFTLTIIGEGLQRKQLEALVKQLELTDRVTFAGWKTPAQQVEMYHQSHLFLSASAFETFGLTYIEALATGTPCVTTDFPVSREVIPAGTAEYIKSDDPKDWAQQITEIFSTSKYDDMIKGIKKMYPTLSTYTPQASTDTLVRTYETVLKNSKR